VGVVGWWVTWPAESVEGAIVSSYSTPDVGTIKGALYAGLEGQSHPPELMRDLEGSIDDDIEAGGAEMRSILDGYQPSLADTAWDKRVRTGSWVLAADRMFARAAVQVARRFDPQMLAVYLSATDTTAHLFCHSNPWRDEICQTVVDGAYAAVDREVGRVLAAAHPDATVIVVSDHGFDLVRGHEHGWLQGLPGVAIAAGPGVRAGVSLDAATVYDVAPTVLALLGAPLPVDQRGRPWLGILEPERLAALPLATGPGTVPATPPSEASLRPRPAPGDDAMRDRLRALGYIE
jgi:predicted AlkP superfamily phosphohydrolase/phosphomutase